MWKSSDFLNTRQIYCLQSFGILFNLNMSYFKSIFSKFEHCTNLTVNFDPLSILIIPTLKSLENTCFQGFFDIYTEGSYFK